jgi:hypothetical protein
MEDNPVLTPWSERLVCTNGMTVIEDRPFFDVSGNSVEDVLRQIDEAADREFRRAEEINQRFSDLTNHPVADLVRAVDSVSAANGTPVRLRNAMRDRALEISFMPPEGGFTMYDVLNIFTYFATYRSGDARTRFANQGLAGDMLYTGSMVCSHCHQPVDPTQ